MFGLLGHGSDLALDLSGQNQSYFMEYKCIADHLKNLDQVNELVSIIKKLKDLSLSPPIYCYGKFFWYRKDSNGFYLNGT